MVMCKILRKIIYANYMILMQQNIRVEYPRFHVIDAQLKQLIDYIKLYQIEMPE